MSSYSSATVIGNLVRDPEVKYTPNGTAVCNASIAVNEKRKDAEDEVSFIDVTFWGRTAEVLAEYCSKGANICAVGRLKQETWQDKESGSKRSKIVVVAERMIMLGGNNQPKPSQPSVSQEQTSF